MSLPAVQEPVSTASPRKLRAWIPTLVWLCVLTLFSTDTFSAEHTGSVLLKILHALFGTRFDEQFPDIHFFVRKSAHFCSYGFLGALAFFSWRSTLPAPPRWTLRWSLLGLLIAMTAGALDEFHQIFVPSRGPSLRDVLIDTIGAIFFSTGDCPLDGLARQAHCTLNWADTSFIRQNLSVLCVNFCHPATLGEKSCI